MRLALRMKVMGWSKLFEDVGSFMAWFSRFSIVSFGVPAAWLPFAEAPCCRCWEVHSFFQASLSVNTFLKKISWKGKDVNVSWEEKPISPAVAGVCTGLCVLSRLPLHASGVLERVWRQDVFYCGRRRRLVASHQTKFKPSFVVNI